MCLSTETRRWLVRLVALALLVVGACATLDMPTPIEHVQTENTTAPSYEYRPPPMPDAGVADGGQAAAAALDGEPEPDPTEAGAPDGA